MDGWIDGEMNGFVVQCTPLRTQTISVKKNKQEHFTSDINHTKQISTKYNFFM